MGGEETLPKGLQWTGTNVSEYNPQRCEGNHRQGGFLCSTLHILSSFFDTIFSPSYHRAKTFALNQLFQLGRVAFFGFHRGAMVRCTSGLRSTPGKCVYFCAYRGFEYISHRQTLHKSYIVRLRSFLMPHHRIMSHIPLTMAGYLTVYCYIHYELHIFYRVY